MEEPAQPHQTPQPSPTPQATQLSQPALVGDTNAKRGLKAFSFRESLRSIREGVQPKVAPQPEPDPEAGPGADADADADDENYIPSGNRWGKVRKHVVAMSMVKRAVQDNVTLENKMGVYAWDEIAADKEEFRIAVCLQLGIGMSTSEPLASEGLRSREMHIAKAQGYNDQEIPAFTFVEHFPSSFLTIRRHFGMAPVVYDASLGLHDVRHLSNLRVVNRSQTAGKSSSWFFFSADMRFAIKTCTTGDFKTLVKILNSYVTHVQESTLLPKYFGLYTLKFPHESITFVIMNNVFAGYLDIHLRYDLKGSTAGRKASPKELKKKHCVYKDLDLLAEARQLPLGGKVKSLLTRDAKYLASQGVIDYSLLVGVHVKEGSELAAATKRKFPVSSDQRRLYEGHGAKKAHSGVVYIETPDLVMYLGVVDILTLYGSRKRFETFFTGNLLCRDVSCQPPKKYARRFSRFFERIGTTGEVDVQGLDR
eukprot:c26380_g1_i1.p1 GENE.c26380_g1_i1~~c26380_g1_i1.p1  ORF type:complete len:498 (+),score=79.81 c26380_g1_i1:57-1496(+)